MRIKELDLLSPAKKYLSLADSSPCFIFEKRILQKKALEYQTAIKKSSLPIKSFYAIKSNCYKGILSALPELGFGLDASSRRELELARQAKAKNIIYTGPGKTKEDLAQTIKEIKNITIHLDSFTELDHLSKLNLSRRLDICVRINTKNHGGWKKFGIPFKDLRRFYLQAKKIKNVNFCGVHFHNSWNTDSSPYLKTLGDIAVYLKNNFSTAEQQDFKILDIGGGLYNDRVEGELRARQNGQEDFIKRLTGYSLIKSQSMDSLVADLNHFLKNSFFKTLKDLTIYTEPGRWINSHCFHTLLKVIDIKNDKLIILNGGTENFGFVIKDLYYYPIFNLTHPGSKEKKLTLAGALCSIDDIWGYYCYMSEIKIDDIIMLPFQGAYTYSHSKDFIRPFPLVYKI
jgi:diaminopimelate decarboxylase